jgi:putative transposase
VVLFRGERNPEMATRGHNEEAVLRVLWEAESGETLVEVCRKHGIIQQKFYLSKKYSGMSLSERRELRQLREEIRPLRIDTHRPYERFAFQFGRL